MNVGFVSSNWVANGDKSDMGASCYYRGALPASQLAAHGFGGHIGARWRVMKDGSLQVLGMDHEYHECDVVWTQQFFHRSAVTATKRARAAGQVVIGDIDDDYWAIPTTNVAVADIDTPGDLNRGHYFAQLAACDAIITSTEALAYKAARLGPPVYLCRNAIDTTWITPHDPARLPVSWIGSTPWRAHDLYLLRAAGLSDWLTRNLARAYHGGALDPPRLSSAQRALGATHFEGYPTFSDQTGVHPDQVTTRPNVPFKDYPGLWDDVGVSLVPLEDVAFNHGKSWLKSLESCASGVPYIVSAGFTEQDALIAEGTCGRTARSDRPREWLDHLDQLRDPHVRREEGRRNRLVAEANDVSKRWLEWLAVIEDVAGKVPRGTSSAQPNVQPVDAVPQ